MTDRPLPWTERLREWAWPWFPVFAVSVVIFLAFLYFFPFQERAERRECKRLYDTARTLSDTMRVDGTVPFNEVGKSGIKCAERRRLGQLQ